MDLKKFWKDSFGGFILKNVLIAIAVLIVLASIVLFAVSKYTHHGEFVIVPNLKGSYVEEAATILAKQNLYITVIDSVHVIGKTPGTIVEQIPAANSSVKSNRAIYVIINSKNMRLVSLPDVIDISYRQAQAMLESLRFKVVGLETVNSAYKDLVVAVKYNNAEVQAGAKITEGSEIILVVGSGSANGVVSLPDLKLKSLEEATMIVQKCGLSLGMIHYDVTPSDDIDDYVVYRQRPAVGTNLVQGATVDIYLSKDKARANEQESKPKTEENQDDFF